MISNNKKQNKKRIKSQYRTRRIACKCGVSILEIGYIKHLDSKKHMKHGSAINLFSLEQNVKLI